MSGTILQIDYSKSKDHLFQLTKLNSIYSNINIVDAEKAFEISFYLLKELKKHGLCTQPYLICLENDRPVLFQMNSIEKHLIKGHFTKLIVV